MIPETHTDTSARTAVYRMHMQLIFLNFVSPCVRTAKVQTSQEIQIHTRAHTHPEQGLCTTYTSDI